MGRAHGVFASLALASIVLCACSLLVDTSDLSGGTDPSSDGATIETSSDARTSMDGAPLADAAIADVLVDHVEASAPCIAGPMRFCDDFDQTNPGAKWTNQGFSRGAIAYGDGNLSPPHALHASVHAGANDGRAFLSETLTGVPNKIRCELDVKLDVIPASGELDIVDLVTLGSSPQHNVYIALFDGKWAVAEYQEYADGGVAIDREIDLGVDLPLQQWIHVVLDTSRTSATLTMNGAITTLVGLSVPGGTARSVNAGVTYADVPSASLFIDNVDCTTQ